MNICFPLKTYLTSKGGIESLTKSFVKHLLSLGHQVHIITVDDTEETVRPRNNFFIHKIKWRAPSFRGNWRIERNFPLAYLSYSWRMSDKLNQVVKEYSIDIIESSRWFESFFYLFRKSIPVVSRLHISMKGLIDDGVFPDNMRNQSYSKLEVCQMLMSDGVIAVSQYLRSLFLKECNFKKNITVIPNGIEFEKFYPVFDGESQDPLVLFVGRLEEAKGVEFIGEAMPTILSVFPKTKFMFIGDDYEFKKKKKLFSQYLKEMVNAENILILKSIPQEALLKYYHTCWLCVFPSLFESFSLVVLEAMACGKPVIASAVGGVLEIIDHGRTGILVPPRNSLAIANAVIELIKNKQLRIAIGNNSRMAVESNYDVSFVINKTLQFYEKILSFSRSHHQEI